MRRGAGRVVLLLLALGCVGSGCESDSLPEIGLPNQSVALADILDPAVAAPGAPPSALGALPLHRANPSLRFRAVAIDAEGAPPTRIFRAQLRESLFRARPGDDSDHDGLRDSGELELARALSPYLIFDEEERFRLPGGGRPGLVTLWQVSPGELAGCPQLGGVACRVPEDRAIGEYRIGLKYVFLYREDEQPEGLGGHHGDIEGITLLAHTVSRPNEHGRLWIVDEVVMNYHDYQAVYGPQLRVGPLPHIRFPEIAGVLLSLPRDWLCERFYRGARLVHGNSWGACARLLRALERREDDEPAPLAVKAHLDAEGQPHPVVYVAQDKHASYNSLIHCEGYLSYGIWTDDCGEGAEALAEIRPHLNVGERHYQTLDNLRRAGYPHEHVWSAQCFCGGAVVPPPRASCGDRSCVSAIHRKLFQ